MKKRALKRRNPINKRTVIWLVAILAVVLLAYAEVVRPNQDAKTYTTRLEDSSKPLQKCFEDLAKTTEARTYYAPDIPLETKQRDMADILQQINTCREELKYFDESAHSLLTLRLAGYTSMYREAKVNQRQAFDVTGQSNDVLNQYRDLASFLQQYFDHIAVFKNYTGALINDNTYYGNIRLLEIREQTADLRRRADQISQIKAPAEFNDTKKATSDMFRTAADGLESLADGYITDNDFVISTGYTKIDQAVGLYDSTIINMPFEQLNKSYIPKQVLQLPGKVENLLTISSE